jgi:hypothetical protein
VARGPAPSYRDAITAAPIGVGRDAGTPWTSRFGSAQVQEVLAQTLMAARLGRAQNGRFRLDATLLTLERPYAGFGMTVTATIAYRLTDMATGTVVYDKPLTTLGTATLDDAVTNENRLRIADERAVRANLRRLVEELTPCPTGRLLFRNLSAAPFMHSAGRSAAARREDVAEMAATAAMHLGARHEKLRRSWCRNAGFGLPEGRPARAAVLGRRSNSGSPQPAHWNSPLRFS